MRKGTKRLLTVGAVLTLGACGDTVEVVTPPFPDIPPPIIEIPPPPTPPPPTPPPPVANRSPVAVGTIPAHNVDVAGTATVPVAGYFSDPDGDELTYSGSSSNDAVATVSVDGSTATVTGVARGSAVVTITAADPDGLQANQGFNVTVGQDGGRAATVTIFGLRDPMDRNMSVNPTNVSGGVTVLLDVQYNDENVTAIALTLGDNVISCRGTSSDANQAIAGLAESGGAVEVDCYLNTADVMGECMGEQLMPAYANGEYALGAQITTEGGETRQSLATQQVTLKNSGYVMVAHSGGKSLIKGGMNMYGGPTADDNMNSFHACPVAYDGTTVGKMSLRALNTGPAKAEPHTAATSLSFKAPTKTASFNGAAVDMEGPFTWHANSAWNGAVEDEGPGGREHWVFAAETIEDDGGLDVSSKFATMNPHGPYYFDFKAPTAGPININKAEVMAGTSYSGAAAVALTGMADAGAGADAMSVSIAVGDCSNAANLPYNATTKAPNRTTTPFVAAYTGVTSVSELAEDDAGRAGSGQTDNNGLDCYVAELTAFADKLGNAWKGGADPATWMQTANFGVDKTAAVLSDIEPESGHVFRALPEMEFEVDNPDLASGDDGTPITGKVTRTVGRSQVEVGTVAIDGRNATVTLDATNDYFAKNGAKTVNVAVTDGAMPANSAGYSLSFGYDTEAPTVSISKSQQSLGQTGASSVTVSVAGSISDASEIEGAALRLLLGNNVDNCAAVTDTLPDNRTTGGDKRNLENGTNSIAFDASFVIKAPDVSETGAGGDETYCFRLDVEDSAVEADTRGDGNEATFNLGNFTVTWPAGPAPPPAGPTFEFTNVDGTEIDGALGVTEGNADGMMYSVKLANTDETAATVTLTASTGFTVTPSSLTFPHSDGTSDTLNVTVTAAHDLDIDANDGVVTHSATDFGDAMLAVTSNDDDVMLSASVMSVTEDADSATVIITATAGTAPTDAAGRTLTVASAGAGGAVAGDFRVTSDGDGANDIVIAMGETSATDTVYVTALDDADMDEAASEAIEFSVSGSTDPNGTYVVPTSIMIVDVDPDISVELSHSSLDEGSTATVVTVTATLPSGVTAPGIMTFTIADGSACVNAAWTGDTFTINTRGTTGSGTVTVTPVADFNGNDEDCAVGVTVAPAAKANTVAWTLQAAELMIVNADDSTSG